jgi:hypothetical protein
MLTAIADAPGPTDSVEVLRPEWFAAFLADRGTRKLTAADASRHGSLITGSAACVAAAGYAATFVAVAPKLDAESQLIGGAAPAAPTTPACS